jgi:archaemetzincin
MDTCHASGEPKALDVAEELNRRLAAALVRHPDAPPRDGVAECLSRRLLGREESRKPLRHVALAHCVRHLFLGVNLTREPRQRAIVETIPLHVGEVEADAEDHASPFAGGRKFSGSRWRNRPSGMESTIRIVPVNAVDGAFLDRLSLCVEERFLSRAVVERRLDLSRSALNATRGQLFVSTLTGKVLQAHPDHDGPLLALTDFDLYKTSHRFVFGDADETQAVAVVSLHRLRPEFYGEERDPNVLFQRTLKACVHELGHIFGLAHCFNPRCGMYYSNSIFETDNKTSYFCENCDRRVGRARR